MGLHPGDELEIEEWGGKIELSKPLSDRPLIETEDGFLALEPDPSRPPVDVDDVRRELERVREWPHR